MLTKQLYERKQNGNYRFLRKKRNLIDFASNDYLGLARSKTLKRAVLKEWKSDDIGSTGSRLLTGNSTYIQKLEKKIASFHGFSAGLIFNCGYMANLGLMSAIARNHDLFLFDVHIHASAKKGIQLSQSKAFPFRHNDVGHLEKRLQNAPKCRNIFICIESIYSCDGSIAPIREIFTLSQKYGAHLIIDEAHAVGIFGKQGKGLVFQEGLEGKIFAQIVTFGKALGVFGAVILGESSLIETLINFAEPFIYTTALPFSSLASINCTYELFPKMERERTQLQELIQIARFSSTQIQPIYVAGNQEAHALVTKALKFGIDIRALLSPTVQKGKERLRLALHALNTKEELIRLLELMGKI